LFKQKIKIKNKINQYNQSRGRLKTPVLTKTKPTHPKRLHLEEWEATFRIKEADNISQLDKSIKHSQKFKEFDSKHLNQV